MPRWFGRLFGWVGRLWHRLFGRRPGYQFEQVEEFDAAAAKPSRVYIEHRGGKDRWVHLVCPCGCRDVITMNLMTSQRPHWAVTRHEDGSVTIHPSVDKTTGCRSHFFVRRGNIEWAGSPVTS